VVGENSKEAYASGLANLASALGNWKASTTGTRRERRSVPSVQGKRRVVSCRFTTGAFGLVEG
jgi:putative transposase